MTDVQVQAMRYQFVNGERQLVNAGRVAQTDDLGQFRVFGLMPGDYVVRASLRLNQNPDTMNQPDPVGYPGTYYPGVVDVTQAQSVTVTLGQELSSVAFPLVPARLSRVSGIVMGSDGRPLAGGMIIAAAPRQQRHGCASRGVWRRQPDSSRRQLSADWRTAR
jgi:hypothetical protein